MRDYFAHRPHLLPVFLTASMLAYAVGDHPYVFYQLLRVFTSSTAILVTYLAARLHRWWIAWIFATVLLLFNPIWPVKLTKDQWRPIDGATAVVFAVTGLVPLYTKRRDSS